MTKACANCGSADNGFHKNPKAKDGLQSWCKRCHRRTAKIRQYLKRKSYLDLLREQPCVDCGLVEPAIMQFDHVPERGPKLGEVTGRIMMRGWETFLAEIAKCDVVCPNDHTRRTKRRLGW